MSHNNLEFTFGSVAPVFLANLAYQIRNFVVKQHPPARDNNGALLLFFMGNVGVKALDATLGNGLFFGLYQLASFGVLSPTTPMHHSLLNAGKRVFMIIANSWTGGKMEIWPPLS